MMFRRKKETAAPAAPPVMRGRESVKSNDNPLARRFHPEDEPDTIDLQPSSGFNSEPGTADLKAKQNAPESLGIVTLVSETGKVYAQPGKGDQVVYLDGEAVMAPTELRPGDRIRVGNLELQLSRIDKED